MSEDENIINIEDFLDFLFELISYIDTGNQREAKRHLCKIIEDGWTVSDDLWEKIMLRKWE